MNLIIPITPVVGSEVRYLYDVMEFQTYTDEGENRFWRWSKVLQQKDYVTQLTPEQKDQVGRVQSMINALITEYGYDTDWARKNRNFALIFGYVFNHVNNKGEVVTDLSNRKMALIVMPSKNAAKSFTTLAESMASSPEGDEFYNLVFNREVKDRKYFLELSFKQGSGFGYDVALQAKGFDLMTRSYLNEAENKVSAISLPEELVAKCTNQASLLTGIYEGSDDFSQENMNLLENQVHAELDKSIALSKGVEGLPKPPIDDSANHPSTWQQN